MKDVARKSIEAMQVGALTVHELNQWRRQAMKYDLLKKYWGLCSPPKEETKQLFGEDLGEKMKAVTEANKMGHQFAYSHPQQ